MNRTNNGTKTLGKNTEYGVQLPTMCTEPVSQV